MTWLLYPTVPRDGFDGRGLPLPSGDDRELKRRLWALAALIAFGLSLMIAVVVIAWSRYGAAVDDTVRPAPVVPRNATAR
jgi:hypothetical protein